jgi:hypothetical protein
MMYVWEYCVYVAGPDIAAGSTTNFVIVLRYETGHSLANKNAANNTSRIAILLLMDEKLLRKVWGCIIMSDMVRGRLVVKMSTGVEWPDLYLAACTQLTRIKLLMPVIVLEANFWLIVMPEMYMSGRRQGKSSQGKSLTYLFSASLWSLAHYQLFCKQRLSLLAASKKIRVE